jgi:hypothetical protein
MKNMIPLVSLIRNIEPLRTAIASMSRSQQYRHVSFWKYHRLQSHPQQLLLRRYPQQSLQRLLLRHQPHQPSTVMRSFTSTKLMDPDRCNLNVIYRYASDDDDATVIINISM